MQQNAFLLVPAIKGCIYVSTVTHFLTSQPTLIKLDNENIGGHCYTFTPSSPQTTHSCEHYRAPRPGRPIPDNYTFQATDEQRNRSTLPASYYELLYLVYFTQNDFFDGWIPIKFAHDATVAAANDQHLQSTTGKISHPVSFTCMG